MSFLSHVAFFFFPAALTGPPGVSLSSFAAQPPDLLLRFYVYLLGFGLISSLTLRLALYPVSVRRLLGFATPLPPPPPSLTSACGSLHLAVNTRGGTFTRKNCAMPGTHMKRAGRFDVARLSFSRRQSRIGKETGGVAFAEKQPGPPHGLYAGHQRGWEHLIGKWQIQF